nr:hypothetical protein [Bacteroidota bacterium]
MALILYSAVLGYLNTDWNTRIFNTQHQIIQGCNFISGGSWYNELATIPRPNHSNQFYVFSVGTHKPYNQGCYYTLVDMSLNGGMGAVVAQNIKINNETSADCIQAIKHGNGRDWWIVNKYYSPNAPNHYNRFFVYLVTPDSIYTPTIQNFNDATDAGFQKMVFNSDGTRFMNFNAAGYMSEFNFDRCTGVISLNKNIFAEATLPTDTLFWEGAYSPNDSVFYVSTNGIYKVDTIYLLQLNLFAPNIPSSSDTLETILYPKVNGAVRLAPDGKNIFKG